MSQKLSRDKRYSDLNIRYFLGIRGVVRLGENCSKNNTIFEELYLRAPVIFLSDSGFIGFERCCNTRIWHSRVSAEGFKRMEECFREPDPLKKTNGTYHHAHVQVRQHVII